MKPLLFVFISTFEIFPCCERNCEVCLNTSWYSDPLRHGHTSLNELVDERTRRDSRSPEEHRDGKTANASSNDTYLDTFLTINPYPVQSPREGYPDTCTAPSRECHLTVAFENLVLSGQ